MMNRRITTCQTFYLPEMFGGGTFTVAIRYENGIQIDYGMLRLGEKKC